MSGAGSPASSAAALLTLAFVLVFNFFLFRVDGRPDRPSSPACPVAPDKEIEKLKADYGLDKPLLGQFVDYVGDTLDARPRDQPADARAGLGPRSRTRCRGRCCWSGPGRCWRR